MSNHSTAGKAGQARHHPVLFNGPAVRALRADRKTADRRPVAPRNSLVDGRGIGPRGLYGDPDFWERLDWSSAYVGTGPSPAGNRGPYLHVPCPPQGSVHRVYPRVAVGDLCYVREAWGVFDATVSPRDGWDVGDPIPWPESYAICYRADGDDPDIPASWIEAPTGQKMLAVDDRWRPSIHMPKWAARDWLRVESIGPERLQWITEEGAVAEGAAFFVAGHGPVTETELGSDPGLRSCGSYRDGFAWAWSEIYDKPAQFGESWNANHWTWAMKFTRTEAPND